MTRTKRVDRLDLRAAVSRARSWRDTETDTVKFAQATLAAAKREGLQLAVRARVFAQR
jgi:adenylate cyclase